MHETDKSDILLSNTIPASIAKSEYNVMVNNMRSHHDDESDEDDNCEAEKDANGNWIFDKGFKKRINSDVDDDPYDSASKVYL